ncbi:hypothetical protein M885DRAFT_44946 [Pelagophyceae sp. CCMP2097]|nr:hypothetical protein M885DRAFT_44946 [Pelagophyceae sp. CCMP2097]
MERHDMPAALRRRDAAVDHLAPFEEGLTAADLDSLTAVDAHTAEAAPDARPPRAPEAAARPRAASGADAVQPTLPRARSEQGRSERGRLEDARLSAAPGMPRLPPRLLNESLRDLLAEEQLRVGSLGKSRLAGDVRAFAERVSREQHARDAAWRSARAHVRGAVQALWPRASVDAYGSCVTRLSLAGASDLDLVIRLPRVQVDAPATTPGDLEGRNAVKESWPQELARRLRSEPWAEPASVRPITTSRVPVVKLVTVPLGEARRVVHLDVSFEGPWHRGLEANGMVLNFLDESPAARPLLLVLKQHAADRGLCASYTGGLSSYVLTILLARFLDEQPSKDVDMGALLLGFLDFYAHRFDARTTGVSLRRGCYFARGAAPWLPGDAATGHDSCQFDPLYVEDPLCPENNVGRNCFRIGKIQRAWSDAHSALKAKLASPPPLRQNPSQRVSLLTAIIDAKECEDAENGASLLQGRPPAPRLS